MQGHHSKCGSADLLFSAAYNDQRSHSEPKLSVSLLAPVRHECTERQPLDWLWQSEQPHIARYAVPCLHHGAHVQRCTFSRTI